MFIFQFEAKINPDSEIAQREKFEEIGGAYVVAWINFKEFEGAEVLARFYIEREGWQIQSRTEQTRIKKKDCRKKKHKQYYGEAMTYGFTLVFNLWDKNDEDES